jgi:hypothetical protein
VTKLTDDFLRAVAGEYNKHVATGSPAVQIATDRGAPVRTVHRWVMEARRRGFLVPTRQGRLSGAPESAERRALRAAAYREAADALDAHRCAQTGTTPGVKFPCDHRPADLLRARADEISGQGAPAGVEPPAADGPYVQPTEYEVNCLPEDGLDSYVFALTVRYRGNGRWAVQRGEHACLGADGEWAQGVKEYDRGDDWLAAHRFDHDTALRLAREHAPRVTVNGVTVTEALARRAQAGGEQR